MQFSSINKKLLLKKFDTFIQDISFEFDYEYNNNGIIKNYIEKIFSLTDVKKSKVQKNQLEELLARLNKAIKKGQDSAYLVLINKILESEQEPNQRQVISLLSATRDDFSRYLLESKFHAFLPYKNNSIITEISYLPKLWKSKSNKLKILINNLKSKIDNHPKPLLKEDLNLVSNLIKTHHKLVPPSFLLTKRMIEDRLYELSDSVSEETDLIISSYKENTDIAKIFINNNRIPLAQKIYNQSMILGKLDEDIDRELISLAIDDGAKINRIIQFMSIDKYAISTIENVNI